MYDFTDDPVLWALASQYYTEDDLSHNLIKAVCYSLLSCQRTPIMNVIYSLLTGKNRSIERNGVLWNMISSLLFSFQSALLLLIVTRAGGLAAAGVFSITYSISQMFTSIGNFSMREYQVSDAKNQYSFDSYVTSRLVTVFIMLLSCIAYAFGTGLTGEKLAIVAVLSVYRTVDCFDDVLHGELQKQGRLDTAGRIWAFRIGLCTAIYMVSYVATQNMLLSSVIMTAAAILISGVLNLVVTSKEHIQAHLCFQGVYTLLLACIPLCIGAFLYNFLVNSPKYSIDSILSEQMQGVFNILYMPLFVCSMLSTFVFKPYVFQMGQYEAAGNRKALLRLCLMLSGVILGLSVCVVIGGALLGIPVLNIVFGVKLDEYRGLFVLLLAFGSLAAMNSFCAAVITVIRKQMYILAAYVTATIIDVACMNRIVIRHGLTGAGLVFGLAMAVIFVFYVAVLVKEFFFSVPKK